ncbi:hypothetical protein [Vibrio agarivorans]|uniref:Uncharacterized protein n=1 Tax=Vibrio agarivorans TaxID=153622 RepID=A0ABT7Y804_9VIBR|nr:hypothetical protein [Vibrio agarivorans]MDN2483889.1 hypothetical protein [Vibrio agarivorans]
MKTKVTILALAMAATAAIASQNPYDKIDDGVSSVSVSGDSLINRVNRNTLDISNNQARLDEHQSELQSLDIRVSTAEVNISKNTSDIATNRSNIAANTADIATNKTAISRNASNISTNATNISKNASNISSNTSRIGALDGRVSSAEADIRTANNRLNDHANTLADHENRISNNEDEIANGGGGGQPTWIDFETGGGHGKINMPDNFAGKIEIDGQFFSTGQINGLGSVTLGGGRSCSTTTFTCDGQIGKDFIQGCQLTEKVTYESWVQSDSTCWTTSRTTTVTGSFPNTIKIEVYQ